MTLDQFLDEYVPNVLKPMGGWKFDPWGAIRKGPCCPLTAESGRAACFFLDEGERLRLPQFVPGQIAMAADAKAPGPIIEPIRARLLAGLGLTESK